MEVLLKIPKLKSSAINQNRFWPQQSGKAASPTRQGSFLHVLDVWVIQQLCSPVPLPAAGEGGTSPV